MVNWLSMFNLAARVPNLLMDTQGRMPQIYDWGLGRFQFVIGLSVAFLAVIAVDGANLSLLSKVSPQRLRSIVINIGTIVSFLSLTARLMADFQILMVDLSHKLINTDIVNALVIPLILMCFVFIYFVKKHYFFLI